MFNSGLTSYFNIRYLDVNQNIRTGNQMIFIKIGFYKFSENQSNILCITFSSISKAGIMLGRQEDGVASSAKLACSKSLKPKKRSHI